MKKLYPEYRKSNIKWIDTLPSNWDEVSLRWLTKIYSGGTPSTDNEDYWENGTIPWLNSGSVNDEVITEPSAYITEDAYKSSSAKWIPKEALVLALAGQGRTKGMVAQLAIDSTCNQSMAAIIPSIKINPRYLFYWLKCNYQNIRNLAGGDLRDGLNLEMVASILVPVPSKDEQNSIVSKLDSECSRIDKLINEKEEFIKLVQEKRQSLISQAMTKGIDGNAKFKDSGVQWIGDIPYEWNVTSIKNLVFSGELNVQDGNHGELHPVADDYVDEGIPFLMANSVRNGKVDIQKAKKISKRLADSLRIGFSIPHDILLTHKGTLGEVALVPDVIDEPYWMLTPQVTYYRFKVSDQFRPSFPH